MPRLHIPSPLYSCALLDRKVCGKEEAGKAPQKPRTERILPLSFCEAHCASFPPSLPSAPQVLVRTREVNFLVPWTDVPERVQSLLLDARKEGINTFCPIYTDEPLKCDIEHTDGIAETQEDVFVVLDWIRDVVDYRDSDEGLVPFDRVMALLVVDC